MSRTIRYHVAANVIVTLCGLRLGRQRSRARIAYDAKSVTCPKCAAKVAREARAAAKEAAEANVQRVRTTDRAGGIVDVVNR